MNGNKTGVITQIIPRYTSEYYGNLDYNYQMQKRLDKARVGYIPQVRTWLNRVILSSELEGDGYIRCAYQQSLDSRHVKVCKSQSSFSLSILSHSLKSRSMPLSSVTLPFSFSLQLSVHAKPNYR